MAHDLLDILHEAHVEHFVGFVQNQETDLVQFERTAADVVQHAPRRADDDVDAPRQAAQLLAHRGPSVDGRDREPPLAVVTQKFLGGLHGQLARRDEDDGLHALFRRLDLLEYRQPESRRFTRAGLGLRDDVVLSREQTGNRKSLDGGGCFEPFCLDGREHLLAEA